jgi:hypothetical protein
MKLWLAMVVLLLTVPQAIHDPVLERLSKVGRFAFGPTGYAGVISVGEEDYQTVLSRSFALADFEKLFAEGNIQAQCFALVGIHKLNPNRFKELARSVSGSKKSVAIMEGCIVSDVPLSRVLKLNAANKY